jgi:hypothetical protein
MTEDGLDPLRRSLLASVRKGTRIGELRLPVGDGKLLAQIYRKAEVIGQSTSNGEIVLRARLPEPLAARLARAGVKITPA